MGEPEQVTGKNKSETQRKEKQISVGAGVSLEKPWGLAKTHPAMSSQAIGPFPHLGPEGDKVDMRDEETVSPNTLQQTGVGNLQDWSQEKKRLEIQTAEVE